jgi:pimeloyl-ACP methyl ester carboxylesterase
MIPRSTLPGSVAVGLLLALMVSGCATRGVKLSADGRDPRTIAYARAAWPFAMMSSLVYEPERDGTDAALRERFETALAARGWKRDAALGQRPYLPDSPLRRKYRAAERVGLAYDVWRNDLLRPAVIVIAVRGTEFSDLQDWKSNFWWLTRHFTDQNQYRIAPLDTEAGYPFRRYGSDLAEGRATAIVTGHSLGGGVAQTLRYAFPDEVRQAYVFDSSPVTGFTDERENRVGREAYESLLPIPGFPAHRTLRVYAKGEILAYARGAMRVLNPITDNIVEVRFDGSRWTFDPLGHHSIDRLAEDLFAAAYPEEITLSPKVKQALAEHHPWWQRDGHGPVIFAQDEPLRHFTRQVAAP